MADKEIAVKIKVDADGGAKSLSELKKEFKETQVILNGLDEKSKDYITTLKKLGRIKDDMGDLRQTIAAFNPEGKIQAVGTAISGVASAFQAAQGAAALFGTEGEALQKTLLKVQAASAMAEGVKGIISMGDAFRNVGLVMKAAFATNPVGMILLAVTALTSALSALYYNLDKSSDATKRLTLEAEKQKEVSASLAKQYKREIDLLTAQGASSEVLLAAKKKLIASQMAEIEVNFNLHKSKLQDILDNDSLMEGVWRMQKALYEKLGQTKAAEQMEVIIQANKKERAKEDLDAIAKNKSEYADLKNSIAVLDAEDTVKKKTEYAKQKEERDKASNETLEYSRKYFADEAQAQKDEQIKTDAWENANIAEGNQRILDENAAFEQNKRDQQAYSYEYFKQQDAELAAEKKKNIENNLAIATAAIKSTQMLSDMNFAHQLKMAKGNSAKELEIKKKQFKVNKAMAIASALISGAVASVNALSAAPFFPMAIIGLAMATLTTVASVAKIASTKFEGGDTSISGGDAGGSMASLGSASGGVALAPPTSGSTSLNADGTVKSAISNQQPTVKAIVVETDITTKQKRVNTIEERASL